MNQSSTIAAFLLAGFVLFLAARNRLGAYTAVLWGSAGAQPLTAAQSVSQFMTGSPTATAPASPSTAAPASPVSSASPGSLYATIGSAAKTVGTLASTAADIFELGA